MKEGLSGAKRLANILWRYSEDEAVIKMLAAILNYVPEQLKEDIQALEEAIGDN